MNRTFGIVIALSVVIFINPSVIVSGENNQDGGNREEQKIHLPEKMSRVLSAEMNRLQNGMTILAIAIPAGIWSDIAETAGKMKEGYIMKNKLSKKEMDNFHASLPSGYLGIDNEFQEATALLINAAKKHDIRSVNVYFCKLNETCVDCHSRFGSKRFPGLRRHASGPGQ
jgi:hypothetical protein